MADIFNHPWVASKEIHFRSGKKLNTVYLKPHALKLDIKKNSSVSENNERLDIDKDYSEVFSKTMINQIRLNNNSDFSSNLVPKAKEIASDEDISFKFFSKLDSVSKSKRTPKQDVDVNQLLTKNDILNLNDIIKKYDDDVSSLNLEPKTASNIIKGRSANNNNTGCSSSRTHSINEADINTFNFKDTLLANQDNSSPEKSDPRRRSNNSCFSSNILPAKQDRNCSYTSNICDETVYLSNKLDYQQLCNLNSLTEVKAEKSKGEELTFAFSGESFRKKTEVSAHANFNGKSRKASAKLLFALEATGEEKEVTDFPTYFLDHGNKDLLELKFHKEDSSPEVKKKRLVIRGR